MIMMILGLVVLGFLVLIHELGHFLAAKMLKIPVLAFSIGFGKPYLSKKIGETEYRLSPIPFGGYVSMDGEDPENPTEGGFLSRPVWQRAVVAIMGPLFNIVSAFIFLWIMFVTGVPHSTLFDTTVVGRVSDSTLVAGKLSMGDSITSVNGKEVKDWVDLTTKLSDLSLDYKIEYYRDGEKQSVNLHIPPPNAKTLQQEKELGLYPIFPPIVGLVTDSSPAALAGISENDTIVMLNGKKTISWYDVVLEIGAIDTNTPSDSVKALVLTINNNGTRDVSLIPKYSKKHKRFLAGITVKEMPFETRKLSIGNGFKASIDKEIEYTVMIFDVLKKLFTRTISPEYLSGPVGIMQMSGAAIQSGLYSILNLMALISINLGVVNLLPIVVTDGGILFLLLVELIRKKPLPYSLQSKINMMFFVAFIILFLFVTLNDILRFGAVSEMLK